ncbi:MAG: CHAT domain-containing protein [Cyanobacteria bacterium P01_C01_bin.89]
MPSLCGFTKRYPAAMMIALAGAIATGDLYLPSKVIAQGIIPASDEISTQVQQQGGVFTINGGQRSQNGRILFHSFDEFNLNAGETARFVNEVETNAILGRVVGGNPSHIDGLIQLVGDPSGVYLLNPAGIVFGPNAALDVPRSFVGSTATGIGLEDIQGNIRWFDVFSPLADHRPTGYPSVLRFEVENPGGIVNFGSLATSNFESLWLVGGSILQAGLVKIPFGKVALASVDGYHHVSLGPSLDPVDIRAWNIGPQSEPIPITPLDLPTLLTGAEGLRPAGDVAVTAEGQVILQGADFNLSTNSPAIAGTVIDTPQGSTIFTGTVDVRGHNNGNPHFGTVVITGRDVYLAGATIDARAPLSAGVVSVGSDIRRLGGSVETERLFVDQASTINASAIENGNGGIVMATAARESRFLGQVTAHGGAIAGNGGITIIGGNDGNGAINLYAPNGQPGVLASPDTTLGANVGTGLARLAAVYDIVHSSDELSPIFVTLTESVDLKDPAAVSAALQSFDTTLLGTNAVMVSASAVESLNAADAILGDAFDSVNAFTTGNNQRQIDVSSLMLEQDDQILNTANVNTTPTRQELSDSLDTLTASEIVGNLERLRAAEYGSHWGVSYQAPVVESSVESIQTILQAIAQRPGKKAAVIYAFINGNDLELTLVLPSGLPRRHTFKDAASSLIKAKEQLRQNITNPLLQFPPQIYQEPGQKVYSWLLEPFRNALDRNQVELLMFSLDSGLRSLPIAALHDGQHYLIENYAVAIIPSFGLLDTEYKPLKNSRVLVAGASEFNTLSDLPSVPVEIAEIQKNWSTINLTEDEFTLAAMQNIRHQEDFAIAHLATHAVFRDGDPSNSFVQLWGDEQLGLDAIASLNFHSPPLELLVLSACQTAFGNPSAELGFAGLSVQSGAKSVVASLWQVSDAGTLTLMSEFYEHLGDIPTKAEALRQAQLALLRNEVTAVKGSLAGTSQGDFNIAEQLTDSSATDFAHPYFWSGFTLVGSPW